MCCRMLSGESIPIARFFPTIEHERRNQPARGRGGYPYARCRFVASRVDEMVEIAGVKPPIVVARLWASEKPAGRDESVHFGGVTR
jgi:hypothetical protein